MLIDKIFQQLLFPSMHKHANEKKIMYIKKHTVINKYVLNDILMEHGKYQLGIPRNPLAIPINSQEFLRIPQNRRKNRRGDVTLNQVFFARRKKWRVTLLT